MIPYLAYQESIYILKFTVSMECNNLSMLKQNRTTMKKSISLVTIIFLAFLQYSCSKTEILQKSISNGVELSTEKLNLRIQFYSDEVVRITKWLPEGTADKISLSVIQTEPDKVDYKLFEDKKHIILSSDQLQVQVSKSNLNITFTKTDGGKLLQENTVEFSEAVYDSDTAYHIKQNFLMSKEEGIYGLGQHQYGYMNYRGKSVTLVQTNTDAVNPFLISTISIC